jgi:hypothetical protein
MSYPRTSRVRRALQERSSAHTNERSPNRSVRMVSDQEDVDMYTATPFPTKPEQILLPMPGKGQQEYISDIGFSYSDHHLRIPHRPSVKAPTAREITPLERVGMSRRLLILATRRRSCGMKIQPLASRHCQTFHLVKRPTMGPTSRSRSTLTTR